MRTCEYDQTVLCVEQTGREIQDAGERADQIPADRIIAGDSSGELSKAV